jgi:hypothetical protein
MSFAHEAEGANSKLTSAIYKWQNIRGLAPEILEFIRKYPNIADSASCQNVMMAFYYMNHPDATDDNIITGMAFLGMAYEDADK